MQCSISYSSARPILLHNNMHTVAFQQLLNIVRVCITCVRYWFRFDVPAVDRGRRLLLRQETSAGHWRVGLRCRHRHVRVCSTRNVPRRNRLVERRQHHYRWNHPQRRRLRSHLQAAEGRTTVIFGHCSIVMCRM